jgi:multidrug efflux pump subunit AcrA (membrane-fusion protein)
VAGRCAAYKAVFDSNLKQGGNTSALPRHMLSRISVLALSRPRGALRPGAGVNARRRGLFGPGALYFKPDLIREHARPVRAVFKFVVPIVLLAASLAGAGYLRSTRPAVQPAPAVERVWTVRAEPARFADHRPVLQLFGDLVAGREVTLRPLVAGEVIETSPMLVEGGRVAKGELIAAIDPFRYRIALRELSAQRQEAAARRTQLQSTLQTEWTMLRLDESQLELARRDLMRREQLLGRAAGSEKALDDARMAVAQHEAALAQRRQAIDTLDAQLLQQDAAIERLGAAIERAERDLANAELRAPFAGGLSATHRLPGNVVFTKSMRSSRPIRE